MVLTSGIIATVVMAWSVVHFDAVYFTMHRDYSFTDLFGRIGNLTNLRHTGNVYVPFAHLAFTYPPGAIFFFWPLLWIPIAQVALVWTISSLLALAGTFFIALRRLSTLPTLVLAGVASWTALLAAAVFPEVTECLTYGQTATMLILFIVADMLAVRGPAKGVLVGLATAFKIYPVVFIVVWLLRRQWRAAATAAFVATAVSALAMWIWPASGRTFLHDLLFGGGEFHQLTLPKNIKSSASVVAFLQRPPFHLASISPHAGLAASLAVVAVILYSSHRMWRRGLELGATVVALIAAAVGSPVAWDHYFSFLPLLPLVAWEAGVTSGVGVVALLATACATVPWINFRYPAASTTWARTYAVMAQNALFVTSLAVAVAGLLRRRRIHGPPTAKVNEEALGALTSTTDA